MPTVGTCVRTLVDTPYMDGGNKRNNRYPKGTIGFVSHVTEDGKIVVVLGDNENNTRAPYYRSLHLEMV